MADKKNFVLRIDENVYKALEKWAQDEFRSVNGQIEWIISQQLQSAGRLKTTRNQHTSADREKNNDKNKGRAL